MGPNSTIAREFFDSVQAGDGESARALCSPDIEFRRNGVPEPPESVLAIASTIKKLFPDFGYDDVVRVDTENGFVEEHSGHLTRPDGREVRTSAVVVGVVANGKIVSMHEYVDSAQGAQIREAIQEAMAG